MVTGGTVSVQVGSHHLSHQIAVTPRSGWAFQAVPAQKVANGTTPELTVPNPPTPGKAIAYSELAQEAGWEIGQASDGGPNHGFFYVQSVSNFYLGKITRYWWVIAPDSENPSSTFFQMQCGNYDPVTNTGFISGAFLRDNAIHHESANRPNSHYYQYVQAQNNPNNNLGVAAEAFVKPPGMSRELSTQRSRNY
jgi:hypothetical protein